MPDDLIKNLNLNTREARLEFRPELYYGAMNLVCFKFFAIEFYEQLFGIKGTTIPSIMNIEYDFQNFTH